MRVGHLKARASHDSVTEIPSRLKEIIQKGTELWIFGGGPEESKIVVNWKTVMHIAKRSKINCRCNLIAFRKKADACKWIQLNNAKSLALRNES